MLAPLTLRSWAAAAAARRHAAQIEAVAEEALAEAGLSAGELSGVACTVGPGLGPCLDVGLGFAGQLAAKQTEAFERALAALRSGEGGATLVLPCGFGKTVLALALCAALGRKALVLVPAKTTGLPNTCCQLKVRLALPPALLVDKAASSTNGPLLATTADCCTLATGKGLLNARAA